MKLLLLLLFFGATSSFLWFCLLCLRMIPFSKGEWCSFLHFQCCASVPGITPQYSQLRLQLSKNEILILSLEQKILTNRFYWVTRKELLVKLLYTLMSIQLLNCDIRALVFTAWKVSVFGVFLFAFGLNMERYSLSLRIQSEFGTIITSSCHWSHLIPPENIRRPSAFLWFQVKREPVAWNRWIITNVSTKTFFLLFRKILEAMSDVLILSYIQLPVIFEMSYKVRKW